MSGKKKPNFRTRLWVALGPPQVDLAALEAEFPTEDDLNDDADFNRHSAVHFARKLDSASQGSRAAVVEVSKWLLTSLLALNAGGMIAVSQLEVDGTPRFAAGVLFLVGVLLPLLSGHVAVKNGLELSLPMGEQTGYWEAVEFTGFRVRETELKIISFTADAMKKMRIPYALAILSTIAFAVGCVVLGFAILAD